MFAMLLCISSFKASNSTVTAAGAKEEEEEEAAMSSVVFLLIVSMKLAKVRVFSSMLRCS
jgi:hypothetical protein